MSSMLKWRLTAFLFAIALMAGLVLDAARSSWRGIRVLRDRLTEVEFESFHLADHFQKTILGMNNLLLQHQLDHDPGKWNDFLKTSAELNQWIDDQAPKLSSDTEKAILDQLNIVYDDYLSAAQLAEKPKANGRIGSPLAEVARFEQQSEKLLGIVSQLANAHRESLGLFLSQSNASLRRLQLVLLAALLSLLICGAGLAVVVYRGLIGPLRVKLVESEALLERHEKLASLGMLAAGVAHEIRNPLTAIKARLYTLHKRLVPGTPDRADTTVIEQEINRLERIVKDFLLFARPSDPDFRTIPASDPVSRVHALLAPQLEKSEIALVVDKMSDAPIKADQQQIQQVLINLIQNAAESIEQHGTVTLRARADLKRLSDKMTEVVILEVQDTGKGIPPEVQKRLFDPFFSTKETGTGLGLAIAARIVNKHGGALQYQTQMNYGTTFGIVLPRVAPGNQTEEARGE